MSSSMLPALESLGREQLPELGLETLDEVRSRTPMDGGDPALLVDHDGGGQSGHPPLPGNLAIEVQEHGQLECQFGRWR